MIHHYQLVRYVTANKALEIATKFSDGIGLVAIGIFILMVKQDNAIPPPLGKSDQRMI